MMTARPRVLIEEWLPIAELGIESRRESEIASALPPIRFLHVWWARRPLAASAGVVLASVMPAWSEALVAQFPSDPRVASDSAYRCWFLRLCGISGDPVKAKAEIRRRKDRGEKVVEKEIFGYERAYTNRPNPSDLTLLHAILEATWGHLPYVIDPTAGGGSIPYEAARYGLPATANDLNGVAAAVLRAGVQITAEWGTEISGDIRKWGESLSGRVRDRLAPYFPLGAKNERVAAYIFARTVACPRTGKPVPLAPNWWLRSKAGKEAAVRTVTERDGRELDSPEFEVLFGPEAVASLPDVGTVAGGNAVSIWDGLAIDGEHIKAEAQAGRMGSVLYAVAVRMTGFGKSKRTFRPPTQTDLDALAAAEAECARILPTWLKGGVVPTEDFPAPIPKHDIRPYGFLRWVDFFSPRQLLFHGTFTEEYQRIVPEILDALGDERGRAVAALLGLMQGKALNWNGYGSSWDASRDKVRSVFERHDFAFKWTFAEFEGSQALPGWCLEQMVDAYDGIAALYKPGPHGYLIAGFEYRGRTADLTNPVPGPVKVTRGNAGSLEQVESGTQTLVAIDPPYYDNVMYGELSDYFGVWEQHTIGRMWPDLFPGGLADQKNEAVANVARFADFGRRRKELATQDYESKMQAIFAECSRILASEGVLAVMFTHKRAEAWDTLGMALMESGFSIETSWPVNTESEQSTHQAKKNAAASTIMLVCRKRLSDPAQLVYFEDIEAEVRSTAREKAQEFAVAGIDGVDLLLSSYGPALSVISRHWPVMSSEVGTDGSSRRLRPEEALHAAREEVVALRRRALVGKQMTFDPLTDFVLLAWSMFRAEEFPYDEARRLALAVGGNDVESLALAKVLTHKAGAVVLAKPSDRRKRVVSPVLEGQIAGQPLVDVLHAVMVIAEADGLAAAKAVCDRLGLLADERFVSLVQAMVRAVPRTKVKGKFVRSEADVLDRFCTAYVPQVELPVEESDTLFSVDE